MEMLVKEIKTYEGWNTNSIYDYLKVGDIVDAEMVEHFRNVLPPACDGYIVQCGEPYDYVEGRATFLTFEREDGNWMYRGNCHRGSNINKG